MAMGMGNVNSKVLKHEKYHTFHFNINSTLYGLHIHDARPTNECLAMCMQMSQEHLRSLALSVPASSLFKHFLLFFLIIILLFLLRFIFLP